MKEYKGKALTKTYNNGNTRYRIERADLFLSQHIGEWVTIKEIRTFACSEKISGGIGNYVVRQALQRYDYELRFEKNTRHYKPKERIKPEPIREDFALGEPPVGRNGRATKSEDDDSTPHEVLWRRLICSLGCQYRDCITATREEAIAWNEANIGKNKAFY